MKKGRSDPITYFKENAAAFQKFGLSQQQFVQAFNEAGPEERLAMLGDPGPGRPGADDAGRGLGRQDDAYGIDAVADAWEHLSPKTRKAIMRLVRRETSVGEQP